MGTAILIAILFALGGGGRPDDEIFGPPRPDPDPDPDDDDAWLGTVDALVSPVPRPNAFYRIKTGDTASGIAGQALLGNNNGSNRVRLIKCMTRVSWNDTLYASTRHPASWGTLFDVNGENLSAAFLPRNASAVQFLAQKKMPPRTITASGGYVGQGPTGYFGLLWIPPFQATPNAVACQETGPPNWLISKLE